MLIDNGRREFVAKLVADLAKAIFAVGLASYLFEKFPMYVRITLILMCFAMLLGSVAIQPLKKGD